MDSAFISKYLLPVVLGLIMYNLGLSLIFKDFKEIFTTPKALIIGLCCQMILLPIIAFCVALITDLSPAIKVGIVILAACPGGATSNLITYLLKGDVAFSISLTSINSFLILFSIPGITFLAMLVFFGKETLISLSYLQTIERIFLMILLPTILGMVTRRNAPDLSRKVEQVMKYVTTILLALVFAFAIFANNNDTGNSFDLYKSTAPFVLTLNFAGMLAGYLISRIAGFNKKRQITLVIEVGIQNSALAITIASSQAFLGNPQMAIPALVYGMFTFFTAVLFGYIIKRWFR